MALGLSLFPASRGDRNPCPAKPETGRKTVFGLRDCAWRVRDTDPRRTIGKLGQTRRTRQAVAPKPESNTKACVRLLTVGTVGTTQREPGKYRTEQTDSGSPPCHNSPSRLSQNHSQSPISFWPARKWLFDLDRARLARREFSGISARQVFRSFGRAVLARTILRFRSDAYGPRRVDAEACAGFSWELSVDRRARHRDCCACFGVVWT